VLANPLADPFCRSNLPHLAWCLTTANGVTKNPPASVGERGAKRSVLVALDACEKSLARDVNCENGSKVIDVSYGKGGDERSYKYCVLSVVSQKIDNNHERSFTTWSGYKAKKRVYNSAAVLQ